MDNYIRSDTGRVLPCFPPATKAINRAEAAKQQQLENYQILRALALRGELEAFIEFAGLDFETAPQDFDATVAREGQAWLRRGGAL